VVDAFFARAGQQPGVDGPSFQNLGGLGNTISFNELMELIGDFRGEKPEVRTESWRLTDQRHYVSDTRKFDAATEWTPKVNVRDGWNQYRRHIEQSIRAAAFVTARSSAMLDSLESQPPSRISPVSYSWPRA
jgi:CDP-paratose 2-epimerase